MLTLFFLSFISGFALLLGLNPHTPFYFFEKMGNPSTPFIQIVSFLGVFNGAILLLLFNKKEKLPRPFMLISFFSAVIGCCLFEKLLVNYISSLRHFTWIFFASTLLLSLIKDFQAKNKEVQLSLVAFFSLLVNLPGAIGGLLLLFILRRQKFSYSQSLATILAALSGFLLTKCLFLISSLETISISSPYLVAAIYLSGCLGILIAAFLLQLILNFSKEKILILLPLAGASILLFMTSRYGENLNKEIQSFHLFSSMGTTCEITIWSQSSGLAENHLKKVQDIIDNIENIMSNYKPDSELSRLNKTAFEKPFMCSDILWENFLWAEKAYQLSEKSFDVTIAPLVNLWSIKKRKKGIPSPQEINESLKIVGFDKLILNHKEKSVQFSLKGMSVDFGGLTKGWAVDKAVEYLYSVGEEKFIVNLGGNLYCSNVTPLNKEKYSVGLKNPKNPQILCATVEGKNIAVATSGNYEQFIIIDGVRYTHILDPRTGYPVAGVDSVSIVSPSATICDILSTSVFINGSSSIEKMSRQIKNLSILFIDFHEENPPTIIKNGIFTELPIKID